MDVVLNFALSIAVSIGIIIGIIVVLGWLASAPRYRGPVSDHFDGRRFRNYRATPHNDLREAAKWAANRERGYWKPRRDEPPGPPPPPRVEGEQLRVTFVNHTTVLLQTQGLNILTDPIWSERCGPVSWFGPRRVRPPGVRFDDLPPIDIVLLSHNHYDHCDLPTLRKLAQRHEPHLVVPLGNRGFLESRRIPVLHELDWWQSVGLAGLTITSIPVRHFSGRGLFDRDRSLWCGYMIETVSGSICFAADTGHGDHFEQIRRRLGAPRLALLPIAAFRPEWFMSRVHMSPEQALEAHSILGATVSVATHYGTFPLADDGETEAIERVEAGRRRLPEGTEFWVLGFGESRTVGRVIPDS
jgi:L-ascorbate metabolism protein UlaG (beta-lactamase superfamily)